MLGIFKYSDLTTKIRAMKGKMLSKEDYEQLMSKTSVRDVALYLKNNTYYSESLTTLNENDVHRGKLEVLLYRAVVKDALKIAKHLRGNNKRLYRYFYRKLEIEDVKKMLRTLQMGNKLEELNRDTLFVSRYSRINFNKSLQAKTIEQLIETLQDTNFYKLLKPLVSSDGKIELFASEMVLDLYYFHKTADQVKKMTSGKDRELLEELFGLEADFKNIFWIYRAKKYYDLSKEMIYRYLIPHFYKIKKSELHELIEAKDLEAFVKLLNKTLFGKFLKIENEGCEIQFLNYMYKVEERSMKNEPFSIAPVIGYIYLKELEVINITNIVEGIRYKASNETIMRYLVGMK